MNSELCSTLFLPFNLRYRFKLDCNRVDFVPLVFTSDVAAKAPSFALKYINLHYPDDDISIFQLYLIAIEQVCDDQLPSKPLLTGSIKIPIERFINLPIARAPDEGLEDLPIFSDRLSEALWVEYYYPELHRFLRCDATAYSSGIKSAIDLVKSLPYNSMLLSSLLEILDISGNWSDYDLSWFHSTMLRLYGEMHNLKK